MYCDLQDIMLSGIRRNMEREDETSESSTNSSLAMDRDEKMCEMGGRVRCECVYVRWEGV